MSRASAAHEALLRVSANTERLLTSLPGTTVAIPGSRWNAGEVGAHLVIGLRAFTDAVRGVDSSFTDDLDGPATFHDRLAAINARTVGEEPQHDLATLGPLIVEATQEFLDASAEHEGKEPLATPWYGDGAALSLEAATCLLIGEQLVHGYDVARAVGARWPVEKRDALLVARAAMSMMPLMVNRAAVGDLTATYGIRLRGGDAFTVRVADSEVRVRPGQGAADCHLSVDPVAFMLVGYGRVNQWRAITSGKLLAWGRKPWLGPRFKGLFDTP